MDDVTSDQLRRKNELVTVEQTRSDLEELYASLCEGWTCLGGSGESSRCFGKATIEGSFRYGAGNFTYGCLSHQMCRLPALQMQTPRDAMRRRDAMRTALGFNALAEMFTWNDDTSRTWDEVKDRVKDAIGRL